MNNFQQDRDRLDAMVQSLQEENRELQHQVHSRETKVDELEQQLQQVLEDQRPLLNEVDASSARANQLERISHYVRKFPRIFI